MCGVNDIKPWKWHHNVVDGLILCLLCRQHVCRSFGNITFGRWYYKKEKNDQLFFCWNLNKPFRFLILHCTCVLMHLYHSYAFKRWPLCEDRLCVAKMSTEQVWPLLNVTRPTWICSLYINTLPLPEKIPKHRHVCWSLGENHFSTHLKFANKTLCISFTDLYRIQVKSYSLLYISHSVPLLIINIRQVI